jgi:hypothetical protein
MKGGLSSKDCKGRISDDKRNLAIDYLISGKYPIKFIHCLTKYANDFS